MKTWYYGVVYFKNGEASVSRPFDSKEKCIAAIEEGIKKHLDIVEATSYMTRTSEEPITTKKMFGCPKSRDLLTMVSYEQGWLDSEGTLSFQRQYSHVW